MEIRSMFNSSYKTVGYLQCTKKFNNVQQGIGALAVGSVEGLTTSTHWLGVGILEHKLRFQFILHPVHLSSNDCHQGLRFYQDFHLWKIWVRMKWSEIIYFRPHSPLHLSFFVLWHSPVCMTVHYSPSCALRAEYQHRAPFFVPTTRPIDVQLVVSTRNMILSELSCEH